MSLMFHVDRGKGWEGVAIATQKTEKADTGDIILSVSEGVFAKGIFEQEWW